MPRLLFISSTRIGDAVLSTAALEHARGLLGGQEAGVAVTIACGPLAAPLFRGEPGLEALHIIRKQKRDAHWWTLWADLRGGGAYDMAVDVRGSLLTLILPARKRVIFRKRRALHKVDEIGAMFGKGAIVRPKIHLDAQAKAAADDIAPAGAPLLVIALGASARAKMWPADRYEALARLLLSGPLKGAKLVFVGGKEDGALGGPIAERLRGDGFDARDAAGELDLLASAALMARAALYVGNDSGPTHLAAAVGARTLALFGPSDERFYGPRGAHARAIRGTRSYAEIIAAGGDREDRTQSWMGDLAVAPAFAAAQDLLKEPVDP